MKRLLPVALLLAAAADARAFGVSLINGYTVNWPSPSVGFQMDHDGSSDLTTDLPAVARAVASWNNIACSSIVLTQTSTTTSTDTMLTSGWTDGVNRLAWIEDSRWEFGQWVLGVTAPVYDDSGYMEEADIAFNGYSATWSTNGSATDVESVAVHELGHFIGLQHVLNGEWSADPPTMSPSVDPYERTRSLTTDDQAGACYLYPAETYFCADGCDCPAIVGQNQQGEYNEGRLECANNLCGRFVAGGGGAKTLGSTCTGSDCASGLFCQPVGGAGSYCSQYCNPSTNNCPSGFDCYPYDGSTQGACLPRNMDEPQGETCVADGVPNNNGGGGGGGTVQPPPTTSPGSGSRCSCDETYDCDPDCDCDPDECQGCAALPAASEHPFVMFAIAGIFFARRMASRRRSM